MARLRSAETSSSICRSRSIGRAVQGVGTGRLAGWGRPAWSADLGGVLGVRVPAAQQAADDGGATWLGRPFGLGLGGRPGELDRAAQRAKQIEIRRGRFARRGRLGFPGSRGRDSGVRPARWFLGRDPGGILVERMRGRERRRRGRGRGRGQWYVRQGRFFRRRGMAKAGFDELQLLGGEGQSGILLGPAGPETPAVVAGLPRLRLSAQQFGGRPLFRGHAAGLALRPRLRGERSCGRWSERLCRGPGARSPEERWAAAAEWAGAERSQRLRGRQRRVAGDRIGSGRDGALGVDAVAAAWHRRLQGERILRRPQNRVTGIRPPSRTHGSTVGSLSAVAVRTMRWPSGATGSWFQRGAQERQAPWFSFQHFSQAYWRHVMQKLNVLWKSSVTRVDTLWLSSMRAAAMASSSECPSVMTKFLSPWPAGAHRQESALSRGSDRRRSGCRTARNTSR